MAESLAAGDLPAGIDVIGVSASAGARSALIEVYYEFENFDACLEAGEAAIGSDF